MLGKQYYTKPFYQVNMKKMSNKYTINTTLNPTLSPLLLPTLPPNTLAWQSSTLHIHWEIAISSQFHQHHPPPAPPKRQKIKMMIKLIFTVPLHPTYFPLFLQRLLPNPLSRQYPDPNINWEITIFVPPPPPPKKERKIKLQLMVKLLSTTPLNQSFSTISPKASVQYPGSAVSNYSYSLRNCNFHATSTNTKKAKNYNWW